MSAGGPDEVVQHGLAADAVDAHGVEVDPREP
jgi:hypothetical protein